MAVSFEQSVFNALCAAYDNGLYGVMDNKTIHVGAAELDGDCPKATFKILSNEKNINTEEIQSRTSGEIKDIPKDENKETVKESGENKEDIKASGEIQKDLKKQERIV